MTTPRYTPRARSQTNGNLLFRGNVKIAPQSTVEQSPQETIYRQRQAILKQNAVPGNGWATAGNPPYNDVEKEFQRLTLARDWNGLFAFLPLKYWGRYEPLGKYSFRLVNGKKVYVPFSRDDISSFVYSPYYTVQPGYTCSDAQRELGVNANVKGMVRHGQKFRNTDARYIWPIFPGWGYGGKQRYGCEKQKKSTWVKIRGKVAIAGAIVGAVFLGPAIAAKAGSLFGGGATSGVAASGAAGSGLAIGSGGVVTGAATGAATAAQAGFLAKVASGTSGLLKYVNNARTIQAVVNGEMPPPPIEISGQAFRTYAFEVAQDELSKELQRRLTKKEEDQLRAEIAQMQRQLEAATPKNIPLQPMQELATPLKKIQVIEENRAASRNELLLPAALVAAAFILGG